MKKIAFYFSLGLALAFFLAVLVSLGQAGRGINGLTSKLIETLQFGVLFASLSAYFRYFHRSNLNSIWNPKNNYNQSFSLKRSETALIFFLHIFLFVGLSYYRFSKYHNLLFSDVDGDYTVSWFYSQRLWNNNELFYFTANFLQGLGGNIPHPLNTLIDPAYFISGLLGKLDYTLVHVVWAILLFLSTFLFSNIIGLTFGVSILAAWITPLSILYPQPFEFYNVTRLIPHLCTSISVCLLLLSVIWLNKTKIHWLVIRAVAIILLGLYLVASNPGFLLVIFPILLTFALFRIKSCNSIRVRLYESIMFIFAASFVGLTGTLPFLVGLFLNNAVTIFPQDFDTDRGYLLFASTIFSGYGFLTIPFAVLGLVSMARNQFNTNQVRWVSRCSLFYMAAILIAGLFNWRYPQLWRLPSPVYFEFYLWPIYCIAIAYLINALLLSFYQKVLRIHQASFPKLSLLLPSSSFLLLVVIFLMNHPFRPVPALIARPWVFPPPTDSPIMSRLLDDLSHKPGDRLKGRVATFTGMNIPGSINWSDLQAYDYPLLYQIKTNLRTAGLWVNSIPTMAEYNAHITPRFYYFATQFFSRPGDRQVRNSMTLRSLNPKFLEVLGITHVITDMPNNALLPLTQDARTKEPIFLYELKNANKSGASPINLIYTRNIREAINLMKSNDFNFQTTATVEKPLNVSTKLVPASESKIIVNKSSYRVTAKSSGQSVLVLPIEYSSCFKVTNHGSPDSVLDTFPSNTLLMTVLFNKDLDIELKYSNGPFENSSCRLNDYLEFKKRF